MFRQALSASPFLLAAGCVAAPEPAAPPAAVVAATPSPSPAPVGDGREPRPSPGAWRYGRGAAETWATFGTGAAALTCRLPARTVVLSLRGAAGGAITVRTTSATRRLSPAPDGTFALAATDPLLDAMAFSRGRFTVETPGATPLALPVQAEIGRVIEDCRA